MLFANHVSLTRLRNLIPHSEYCMYGSCGVSRTVKFASERYLPVAICFIRARYNVFFPYISCSVPAYVRRISNGVGRRSPASYRI